MFDAYGARASTDNSADPYSGYGAQYGYYSDPETGLQLLDQRYYNPAAGRFVTRDPIGYAGGTNLYSYCRNNPVAGADPSGTSDFFESMFLGYMRFCLKMVNVTGDARYNKAVDYMFPPDPCDGFNYEFPFMIASMMTPGGLESAAGHAVQAAEEAKEVNVIVKVCENGRCFVAGTPVQMADGTTKPIEDVKVGELVQSRNDQTGKTEAKHVLNVRLRQATNLTTLTLADANTRKVVDTIVCTPEHPFNVEGKGWTSAGELEAGARLVTRIGASVIVEGKSKKTLVHATPVYNFTIEDDHTYFVGTGHGGEWVHNTYPDNIRFTQKSIDPNFQHGPWEGRSVAEAVEEARAAQKLPEGITISVTNINGDLVTLNNRSLYVAQQAGLRNIKVQEVGVSGYNQAYRQWTNSGLEGPLPLGLSSKLCFCFDN